MYIPSRILFAFNWLQPRYSYNYQHIDLFLSIMDLPNLENYPVYVLNVVPEPSGEGILQIPQQITSSVSLPYNFYVPNIEHHTPILNTDSVQEVIQTSNNKIFVDRVLQKKTVQDTALNHNQYFK